MRTRESINTDTQEQVAQLSTAGRFALQRHTEARERAPKRAAAQYLRIALTCARQMAKLAPRHSQLWALAQALVAEVISIARQHEADLFEAGGNQGAAYISVWIAAEALQIQIADRAAQYANTADSAAPDSVAEQDVAPPLAASHARVQSDRPHLAPASKNTPPSRKGRKWQRPRPRFDADWS